jgi:hypothetical protein
MVRKEARSLEEKGGKPLVGQEIIFFKVTEIPC